MSIWPTRKLGELCTEITVGFVGKMSDQYVDRGVPFLRSQDINPGYIDVSQIKYISPEFHQRLRKSALRPGDVAIVRTGYPGTTSVIPATLPDANCADLVIARPGPDIDARFLAFALNSPWGKGQIGGRLVGAAQQHFNVKVAQALEFPHPPIETQRRIASILGAYDDLIEVNRRRVAVLEEMARGLFEEEVTKKLGALPPASGGNGQADLPNGWEVKPLGQIADIIMGQSPPSDQLNKHGLGLAFHQGVTEFGNLFPGKRVYCTPDNRKRVSGSGDILFSVRAPVGRINIATEDTVLGRGVAAIRSRLGSQRFLTAHLRATFYETDLIGNGAIYKAVGRADIERVGIACPPLRQLHEIDGILHPFYDLLWEIEQTGRVLVCSRDLLLPRLISGQLSVTSAERELEKVA